MYSNLFKLIRIRKYCYLYLLQEVRCRPPKIAEPGDKEVTVSYNYTYTQSISMYGISRLLTFKQIIPTNGLLQHFKLKHAILRGKVSLFMF